MLLTPFFEQQFPPGVAYGSSGGPRFRTTISKTSGGREKRRAQWTAPLWVYDASKGIHNETQYDEVMAFFLLVGGRLTGFRFSDPQDSAASNQLLDTSGASGIYQLRKGYTFGGQTFWRTITKPVVDAVILTLNGSPVTLLNAGTGVVAPGDTLFNEALFNEDLATSAAIIDYTSGQIRFTGATVPGPGDELRATFTFDVPCRFDTDELQATFVNFQAYQSQLPIVEVRQ